MSSPTVANSPGNLRDYARLPPMDEEVGGAAAAGHPPMPLPRVSFGGFTSRMRHSNSGRYLPRWTVKLSLFDLLVMSIAPLVTLLSFLLSWYFLVQKELTAGAFIISSAYFLVFLYYRAFSCFGREVGDQHWDARLQLVGQCANECLNVLQQHGVGRTTHSVMSSGTPSDKDVYLWLMSSDVQHQMLLRQTVRDQDAFLIPVLKSHFVAYKSIADERADKMSSFILYFCCLWPCFLLCCRTPQDVRSNHRISSYREFFAAVRRVLWLAQQPGSTTESIEFGMYMVEASKTRLEGMLVGAAAAQLGSVSVLQTWNWSLIATCILLVIGLLVIFKDTFKDRKELFGNFTDYETDSLWEVVPDDVEEQINLSAALDSTYSQLSLMKRVWHQVKVFANSAFFLLMFFLPTFFLGMLSL